MLSWLLGYVFHFFSRVACRDLMEKTGEEVVEQQVRYWVKELTKQQ